MAIHLTINVIPEACSGFNKPCYLSKQDIDSLRKLATAVIMTLEELNETYWLDCGTLLGAYRDGDILKYDYDIDISRVRFVDVMKELEFVKRFKSTLSKKYNISGSGMFVTYNNNDKTYTCDMQRYKRKLNSQTNETWLAESVPASTKAWSDNFKLTSFPVNLVLPTIRMQFLGLKAQVPRKYKELLKWKYPYTWGVNFPYKWRCWLPWNLISN